jgi:cyclopropane fatty-acyl-phospholipid synthase-like methyltransferase
MLMLSSKLQEEIYSVSHQDSTEQMRMVRLRILVEQFTGSGGWRILEFGCGKGLLSKSICKINECYGVDISSEQLKKARARASRNFDWDRTADQTLSILRRAIDTQGSE